jgi:hypothetical protein
MKRIVLAASCCAVLLLQHQSAPAQGQSAASAAATAAAAAPVKHGGKIEAKYDGFSFETVVSLKKMNVTCGGARGFKDARKDTCIHVSASLHCPGRQLDYVRRATIRVHFEADDWDARHPPEKRQLVVVADGETLRLGPMSLLSQGVDDGILDEKSKETLEASVPYDTFRKIAQAQTVDVRVGDDTFALRDKNVAALRDLTGRVKQ